MRVYKFFISAIILLSFSITSYAIDITKPLLSAMKAYKVPIVGYAIINNYKIVSAKTISIDKSTSVSSKSLFQAASISKSMTAYGALNLADQNKLKLDNPANNYLKKWKIPQNKYTKKHPVRLKNLMDMTAGLSVSGFAGYQRGKPLPSQLDILNGVPPANNQPIRVFYTPGSKYFYSGGAFQVLQRVITDTTKQKFNIYMNKKILNKLGMQDSIYEYPLKTSRFLARAVPGYDGWDGKMIKYGWHNYMCSGAGGMWSTPADLARFMLNVTNSYLGNKDGLISKKLAKKLLTRQKNTDFGLGFVVSGKGNGLYFWKAGHNYGYHSLVLMFPNTGDGVAIMTNSETGDTLINYIVAIIAKQNHWPYYFPFFDELVEMPNY